MPADAKGKVARERKAAQSKPKRDLLKAAASKIDEGKRLLKAHKRQRLRDNPFTSVQSEGGNFYDKYEEEDMSSDLDDDEDSDDELERLCAAACQ